MVSRKKLLKVAIRDLEHLKRVRPFLVESLDLAIAALEKEYMMEAQNDCAV